MPISHRPISTGKRSSRGLAIAVVASLAACLAPDAWGSQESAARSMPRAAAARFPCSRPNSARVPCRFSTPTGNVRCLWTPHPNRIACELLSSRRAYRLGPYGHAKAIGLRLARRGETLRRNQQIVFPQSLSCHDTQTTMTCNQDYDFGAFTLAPGHSRRS